MGLLTALGVPLAVYIASSKTYHLVWRLLSALAATLMLICLFFTASRGAILALVIGTAVYFAISPVRLRSFGMLALALVPTILIAWWATGQEALMQDHVDLGLRMEAASALRIYIFAALAVVGAVFLGSLMIGQKVKFPAAITRLAGGVSIVSTFAAIAVLVLLFLSSQPSVSDWAQQAYDNFTVGKPSQPAGAGRLIELGSSGRWEIWKEAIANWEDNYVAGSGAQSFPLVHLARRQSDLVFVKQAHGLGFSLLSELGIVGFALGGAFIAVSMTVAALAWCRIRDRWEKGLAAAIISLLVIYLIHTSFDWDWNMFGLTMIYFFFTGIMVAWPASKPGPPA